MRTIMKKLLLRVQRMLGLKKTDRDTVIKEYLEKKR